MDNLEVKRIRESLGLTQQQLAKSCGVSVRSVQNWEAGSVAIPDSKRLLLQSLVLVMALAIGRRPSISTLTCGRWMLPIVGYWTGCFTVNANVFQTAGKRYHLPGVGKMVTKKKGSCCLLSRTGCLLFGFTLSAIKPTSL